MRRLLLSHTPQNDTPRSTAIAVRATAIELSNDALIGLVVLVVLVLIVPLVGAT